MKHFAGNGQLLYKNYVVQPLAMDVLQLFQVFEGEYITETALNSSSHSGGVFLLYCVSGSGTLRSARHTVALNKDMLVLCAEQDDFTIVSDSADVPVRCLGIHFMILDKLYATSQAALELYFADAGEPRTAVDAAVINDVFSHLISELCMPQPTVMMIRGFLSQAFVIAYRAFSSHLVPLNNEEAGVNAVGHTVYAIIRYVDEHLFAMHNLMGMAQELGYSYNYLSHLFRRKTGMTIQAYVSRKKIEKSVELLSDETLSITEIASMLNYDCIQSFSKAFRRAMNMSPTEYRAMHGLSTDL